MAKIKHDLARAHRFKEFRKKYVANGMQNAVELIGLALNRISRIERAEEPIPVAIIDVLVKKFNLNRDWLLENKGNMIKTDKSKKGGLQTSIELGDKINGLTSQVLILSKNLDKAWNMIERLQADIEKLKTK